MIILKKLSNLVGFKIFIMKLQKILLKKGVDAAGYSNNSRLFKYFWLRIACNAIT